MPSFLFLARIVFVKRYIDEIGKVYARRFALLYNRHWHRLFGGNARWNFFSLCLGCLKFFLGFLKTIRKFEQPIAVPYRPSLFPKALLFLDHCKQLGGRA